MTSLNLLPISPHLRAELLQLGLSTSHEVLNLSCEKLAHGLKLSVTEAKATQDYIRTACKFSRQPLSVAELLIGEAKRPHIVTMCKSFDDMLGGGIPTGRIVEICGAPGVGKTQFCFQLCATAQLPECLSGVAGEAVFIDTEGSFVASRLAQISEAFLKHLRGIASRGILGEEETGKINATTIDDVMTKVKYFRCSDHLQLLALTFRLAEMIRKSRIRLVIIDSIAFHFRYDFTDTILRNRMLATITQNLIGLLQSSQVAVVLTNQMTTRFDEEDQGYLTPALGDSWAHVSAVRVLLSRTERGVRRRHARLLKHPSRPVAGVDYQVTVGGVRDYVTI